MNSDGLSVTVSTLRSLDGSNDVIFKTFSLPKDRYLRQLVKTLGR